jgi:hypothetical protein
MESILTIRNFISLGGMIGVGVGIYVKMRVDMASHAGAIKSLDARVSTEIGGVDSRVKKTERLIGELYDKRDQMHDLIGDLKTGFSEGMSEIRADIKIVKAALDELKK